MENFIIQIKYVIYLKQQTQEIVQALAIHYYATVQCASSSGSTAQPCQEAQRPVQQKIQ